ncbi:MAG: aldose epimerase family protein [Pseudomonadota bacterium]
MIRQIATYEGRPVLEAVLESATAQVSVLNYGCVIRDWRVQAAGRVVPVVLGFDRFEDYPVHSKSFGIIAGRVANRTAHGRFTLNGETYQLACNNGAHHLHGGDVGLGRRLWEMEADGAGLVLTYHSPDGEDGYPGAVTFEVKLRLDEGALTFEMSGQPDRPTPINLAQHNYYNLEGGGDVREHILQIAAPHYTPVDAGLIPTGEILPVAGTRMDFTTPKRVTQEDPNLQGIDLNLVLEAERDRSLPAVALESETTGLRLALWTDEPGLQLFNAPQMDIPVPGIDGARYGRFAGLCLEAQHFPDSLNHPGWPSIIARPETPYHQRLVVEIGAG